MTAVSVVLAGALNPSGMAASTVDVPVSVRPILTFKVGSDQKRFGKLEFVGGLIMNSPEPIFGAMSSIRFRPDGRNFLAVLDTGHWLAGTIERNDTGALSGLSHVRIDPMLDENGNTAKRKVDMDAEGLALRGNQAFVSYEQRPRIDIYADADLAKAKPVGRLPHIIPEREFRRNAGMETLARSPVDGLLKGAMVVVAEASFDSNDNLFAAVLEGPRKGIFAVTHNSSFSVTDGAFLPNGDLLLLERRFNLAEGVGMRIRRIDGDAIKPGAVVDGEVLIEADLSNQIDNMEGMDIVTGPDGSTRLILVSDDNHSFLQRNIMLEFKLTE
ncbi:esterase-like activity of phytase family protein [Agrobacterium sp. rho-13.3]|uniref:esterase-like activity of phytase family protein n=1 Tax=Agrobacterium sp. rho-13.3 TaxID=3072980 RepID=UPI002A138A0C|nr:esterase-like activity of phytase family protein [Agrobacterium sp. rho-13.3]MDX8308314.1 esterase-like activity of phytase family protein [Agrobacterium sp. rho-13.3]